MRPIICGVVLGDGQVAGLPANANRKIIYEAIIGLSQ